MTKQGIQEWKVPATGSYTIRAIGAAGGSNGRGRDIELTINLTKSEVILILVGQIGDNPGYRDLSAGGGGTFVVRGPLASPTAILVAGGGGGNGGPLRNGYITDNTNANAAAPNTGNGKNGCGNVDGNATFGTGGSGGGGGSGSMYAQGGAGFNRDGNNRSYTEYGSSFVAKSFINGGTGGFHTQNSCDGGFGGGGSASMGHSGGGGGGYSGGGGGGMTDFAGGGGGSYGITTPFDYGPVGGNGSVIITANF
jgi:hypothetical protein